MNVIWLSANKFGYELLKEAVKLKEINIMVIITLKESSKTVMYDRIPIKKWYEFGIAVFQVDTINTENELIKKLSPDLIVMCGWRQIIKKYILDIPKQGVIGFHPTLLPIGRGPAPIINSILNGFKESGLTLFCIGEGLDDGDIIGQERFEIKENDHATEVYEKTIVAGKKLITRYIPLINNGHFPRRLQDDSKATFFTKPPLENNKIDLERETIEQAYRKIKALSKPYKGAYIEKGGEKLILWRAELCPITK